jgi:dynamin 1-like protein
MTSHTRASPRVMSLSGTQNVGKSLIPLVNRIQDVLLCAGLHRDEDSSPHSPQSALTKNLPVIAVIGSQSSGKSSLLESLVGRDFLPKKNEICTKRPLVLQLVHSPDGESYGEFLHRRNRKYYDFEQIKEEILKETDRVCGKDSYRISSDPIRLRVVSPCVLTMTLVDLPGLTRVPVHNQPQDIEQQIRKLILKYISPPQCIILAVSPANQDLASSDALELARTVDPEGLRTVGVLTKLDIMDKGTDAVRMLRNEVIPLRMGYVGVVLRSQRDVVDRTSMDRAREAEVSYFRSRKEYESVSHCCTVGVLADRLNRVLARSIRESLPDLRQVLDRSLERKRKEAKMYGEAPPSAMNRGALLLSILDSYSNGFAACLQGKARDEKNDHIRGGARIRHVFLNVFNPALDNLDPATELTDDEIRTAIKNAGGISGSLLIPEAPFELLVSRAIEKLLRPALQCREFVHQELINIAAHSLPSEVPRFPRLRARMLDAVEEFISLGAAPAEAMVRNLIDCELSFINTSNPNFIGGNEAIAQVMKNKKDGTGLGVSKIGGAPDQHSPLKSRKIEGLKDTELFSNGWFSSGWFEGKTESDPKRSKKSISPSKESAAESQISLTRPPDILVVQNAATEQEIVQVQVTRVLVNSYFDIVRKNVQDMVPKIVMNFMVNHVQKGLQKHLTQVLYREDSLDSLMREREDIVERRHQCQEAIRAIKKALKIMESIKAVESPGSGKRLLLPDNDQNTNSLNLTDTS